MDLTSTYLGLRLKNPIVPSASPLSREIANLRRMEDAGAAAIVLYSLFEEEINWKAIPSIATLNEGTESFAEALSYFPEAPVYRAIGPDAYLEHIYRAKQAVNIPIIASLNGVSTGGWIRYAKEMEGAGADALELNIYYMPTSIEPGQRRKWSRSTSISCRTSANRINIPDCREAKSLLQRHRQYDGSPVQGGRRLGWSCSIASISPTSIWRTWKWCPI